MATAGKVIKCKAAVAWEPNKPLVIEEIEVAPPQANEVRIKIVATAVCHSDLYYLLEAMPKDGFPTVLGHEAAGIVESIGPGVTEFQPGDKVIPIFLSQCRECRFCKSPKTNQCEKSWFNVKHDGKESRFTCKGKKVQSFTGTGTFSEYTVVNQIAVAKIDPTAPLDKVCLLGCGICTGYGAATELDCLIVHQTAGAKKIIAVDINPEKSEKAKVFGATDFVNPKDHDKPISQVLAEMTNGGVDYSLECTGNVGVMRSALESCIWAWGVSVIVGWTELHDVATRPVQLISGRTWKGSVFGGFKSKDGVSEMVKAYLDKKVKVDEFITHNMTLDQINDAIELMKHSKCIRTVLNISPE
uniref:Alcohol dehydrogenase 6 n=1 Tax=Monopterus albus TaxID=43700 RepID=A0A3Q3J794_MONAL